MKQCLVTFLNSSFKKYSFIMPFGVSASTVKFICEWKNYVFSPHNTCSHVLPLRFFSEDWVFFLYTPAAVSLPCPCGAGAALPLCARVVPIPYWSYPNTWVRAYIGLQVNWKLYHHTPSQVLPCLLWSEWQNFHRADIFCCSFVGSIYHSSDQMYS